MNPTLILFVGGGLGLLLLGIGGVLSLVGRQTVVEERLGRYAETGGMGQFGGEQAATKEERSSPLSDMLNQMGEGTEYFDNISKSLARADLKFRAAEYIALIFISAIGTAIIGVILSRSVAGAAFGIIGIFLPGMYVRRLQKGRLKKFDNQLGDMLNLTVNGLRAGFSTLQAMEAVSRELPAPISTEFHRVVQEIQLGIAMEEALDHVLRRINSDDLDMLVTAINVQREVGGNLAEILDTISYTIRERVRIRGEISALTAQGRATAWVISLLPVALMAILFLVNRPYLMGFFDPETRACGLPMLALAAIMVMSGFFVTMKIVDIDI
ncbi:MAG: type II secretion system F family protein [Anaerolineales bacterium]